MYLSNRLTFSLFSVFLVALCAFGTMPAMAQTTVTVTGAYTPDDTGTSDVDEEKIVLTFTFSHDQPTDLTLADFFTTYTVNGTTGVGEFTSSLLTDPVTDPAIWVVAKTNAKVFTLTTTSDHSTQGSPGSIYLRGYSTVITPTGAAGNDQADPPTEDRVTFPDTDADADSDPDSSVSLAVAPGYIGGQSFAVIATYTNTDGTANDLSDLTSDPAEYPTLPTATTILRSPWSVHVASGTTIPNLYAHFQQGQRGTIGLTHTSDGTARVGDANARSVVINEVMWARDESQVGQAGYTREQWIEIHNRTGAPILLSNIKLAFTSHTTSPDGTNVYTDRLSTYPNFTTVWDITGKGQDGHPGADDGSGRKEFIAMARTNHDDGSAAKHWDAEGDLFLPNYRGTPGQANAFATLPVDRKPPGTDTPAKNKIIINEIANLAGELDWVELRNVTDTAQSLEKWTLSMVTGTVLTDETQIVRFPKYSIPAGGILLLVNADPKDTPLARGRNIKKAIEEQDFGFDGNISYLIVKGEVNHGHTGIAINIPNNNDWMLILRSGQPWDKNVYNTGFKVEDVAGPAAIVVQDLNKASPRKEKKSDGKAGGDIWETTLFPLNGRKETEAAKNHLRYEKDGHTRELFGNTVWKRDGGKHGFQAHAFTPVGFTGIGYDRNVPGNNAHGGTPGYDNGIAKGKVADLTTGKLVISELMLATDNGRYPQWIELQNTSKTHGIDLASDATDPKDGWQIIIENYNSGTWSSSTRPLHVKVNLKEWFKYIPPNQSVLIAAFTGSHSDNLPANRVHDITADSRAAFKMEGRRDSFLNAEGGFYIKIIDGDGNVSDEVGNLDGIASNVREGIGIDEPKGFSWPTSMTDEGARISLVRLKDDVTRGKNGVMGTPGTARVGVPGMETDEEGNPITDANGDPMYNEQGSVAPIGSVTSMLKPEYAWIHATDLLYLDVPRGHQTWFGTSTDKGTPLHISGTPLPVELSFFRPTLEDGQVTIQWTTESELDNAGFNILRSDSRNGEFRQVNEQMIQGKGTTAERSSYKWVDTTAKPGAVYYYQIEDVSFAGEHTKLATTKLKGLISAKGKLTTSWGDIKDASQ